MNGVVRVGAAVTAVVTAGVLAVPGVAEASARGGCYYPQVCFYPGGQMSHPTGRFRDRTTYWQWFDQSFGDDGVYNARRHDAARVLTTAGRVVCVRPGQHVGLYSGGFTAVQILSRSTC